jgi:hypothetical protein
VQPYHPATFLERGVAVPFTTPLLGGTRARPADKKGLELVVANPSGGRGVYVMAWPSITTLCRPTLHDKVLNTRIGRLSAVTPAVMRRIAREIAAEGLAGEAAMEAAQLASDADREDKITTNYELLMSLVQQQNAGFVRPPAERWKDRALQKAWARHTVAQVAPRLNRSTEWAASALEALAEVMTDTGVGTGKTGRIPRLIAMLHHTRNDIADWSKEMRLQEDQMAYARMICEVADLTLSMSADILSQVHGMTGEMVGLLRTWSSDPASVMRLSSRPEWLLDGWEKICLVWDFAKDDATRRAALLEMADLVPILPKEARDWCEKLFDIEGALRFRRVIRLNEDWRTGEAVVGLIARNEQMRAAAC